jgi:hypothetical protein
MKLLHLNRRLHLYLALILIPWTLMYGISSLVFSHNTFFEDLDKAKGLPLWTKVGERTGYEIPIPEGTNLRPLADQILKDTGLVGGDYGAYRQSPTQINVYIFNFWKSTQVKYFIPEKRLLIEDRRFRWDHFLTGMHAKGGFQFGFMHDLWAIFVDAASVGLLLWVLTGLVMWWNLPQTRRWGAVALLSGILSFAIFLWKL